MESGRSSDHPLVPSTISGLAMTARNACCQRLFDVDRIPEFPPDMDYIGLHIAMLECWLSQEIFNNSNQ